MNTKISYLMSSTEIVKTARNKKQNSARGIAQACMIEMIEAGHEEYLKANGIKLTDLEKHIKLLKIEL